jgi:hypothetical protein
MNYDVHPGKTIEKIPLLEAVHRDTDALCTVLFLSGVLLSFACMLYFGYPLYKRRIHGDPYEKRTKGD